MEYISMFKILVVLFIIIIFCILYTLSLINSIKYKVPQVSTFNSDLEIIKKAFWKYGLKWKKIVDLGSGIWKITRLLEKDFWTKSTGYEIDLSNVIISKILNKIFSSNAKIIRWNYFKADLKKYDFIYVYLFPVLMEKIEEKIWADSKKWTIIFVNAFKFKNHETIDIFYKNWKEKIFVYKVK